MSDDNKTLSETIASLLVGLTVKEARIILRDVERSLDGNSEVKTSEIDSWAVNVSP